MHVKTILTSQTLHVMLPHFKCICKNSHYLDRFSEQTKETVSWRLPDWFYHAKQLIFLSEVTKSCHLLTPIIWQYFYFIFLFFVGELWHFLENMMTNIPYVGLDTIFLLLIMPAPYDSVEDVGGHSHSGHMLPTATICQNVRTWRGCTFLHQRRSGAQLYRRASLVAHPTKRDSKLGGKTYWALCLGAEGEPFKKHSTQASTPSCTRSSIITAETLTWDSLKGMHQQINKVVKTTNWFTQYFN